MQTILGAGGAIGTELAKELPRYTQKIRLVSRNPVAVNPSDEIFAADITDPAAVRRAVEGSEVVYLAAGFPYSAKVWRETWPRVMRNTLDACADTGARLVFFDNVYSYDIASIGDMTEDSPINPPSRKGQVRAHLLQMISDEAEAGRVQALVARAADFYGPSIRQTSMLTETVFKNLAAGKKAFWMGDPKCRHAYTYTPDAGKATALLGNTPDAFNQSWHLPTVAESMSGEEWVEAIAAELGAKPAYQAVPKWLVRVMGLFTPIMSEMVEMYYQFDRDYVFRSDKFEARFGIKPTPCLQGIKEIVQTDYQTQQQTAS